VPIGGEPIKYEMDKESGSLQVDRVLYISMRIRRRRSLISAIA
jgi:inorganic pyrophosphatase